MNGEKIAYRAPSLSVHLNYSYFLRSLIREAFVPFADYIVCDLHQHECKNIFVKFSIIFLIQFECIYTGEWYSFLCVIII